MEADVAIPSAWPFLVASYAFRFRSQPDRSCGSGNAGIDYEQQNNANERARDFGNHEPFPIGEHTLGGFLR
jgi:hypothetical protein